jgi:hypothetical protein
MLCIHETRNNDIVPVKLRSESKGNHRYHVNDNNAHSEPI